MQDDEKDFGTVDDEIEHIAEELDKELEAKQLELVSKIDEPVVELKLEEIEQIVNEGAKGIARKLGVPDDKWKILLVYHTKGDAVLRIHGGQVAEILLTWPVKRTELKGLLEDAFRTIKRHNKILEPFALDTLYAQQRREKVKKWIREKCGDQADVLFDLIPRYRLVEKVTTTYELKDTVTGKSVTVSESREGHFSQRKLDNWIALSRLVREVEAVEILPDDELNVTSELDAAISEVKEIDYSIINAISFQGEIK